MFKIILFLKCLILVKSNILQFQSCPLTYQQNFQPQIPQISLNYYDPYKQVLVQNQPISLYTNYWTDQIKRLLLEKTLSTPLLASIIDGHTRDFEPDSDLRRLIHNPSDSQSKIVNNYIILPPEYIEFNSNDNKCNCCTKNDKSIYSGESDHVLSKRSKNDKSKFTKNIDKSSKKCKNTSSKKNMNNSKNKNGQKSSTKIDEKGVSNKFNKPSNSKIDNNSEKSKDQSKTKVKVNNGNSKKSKTDHIIKLDTPKKSKTSCSKDDFEKLSLPKKKSERIKNTAIVDVGLDINEDCTDLDYRRTRNNNCKSNMNMEHQFSPEFSDNIISYMNNIMANQHFNPNFFNSNANFPYNFDYLYQIPQKPTSKSNGSVIRRRNRKKKQRSNVNIKQKKNNIEEQIDFDLDDCKKEVELTPQFIEVEEAIAPTISEDTSKPIKRQSNKIQEANIKDNFDNIKVPRHNSRTINTNTHSSNEINDRSLNKIPIIGQEDFLSYFDDNGISDDYYPDFRSDNIYLSKEDYGFNNNHDRYYYSSDNRAEMSRNKHKYESAIKRSNDQNNRQQKHSKKLHNSLEIEFRAPPALEHPDFKTVRVNKDKYVAKSDIHYRPNDATHNDWISYSDLYGDFDSGVETVFANSKVVTYSPPVREEIFPIFDSRESNKNDDKNLISRNGDTTVVIAKSLGYPDDY